MCIKEDPEIFMDQTVCNFLCEYYVLFPVCSCKYEHLAFQCLLYLFLLLLNYSFVPNLRKFYVRIFVGKQCNNS